MGEANYSGANGGGIGLSNSEVNLNNHKIDLSQKGKLFSFADFSIEGSNLSVSNGTLVYPINGNIYTTLFIGSTANDIKSHKNENGLVRLNHLKILNVDSISLRSWGERFLPVNFI